MAVRPTVITVLAAATLAYAVLPPPGPYVSATVPSALNPRAIAVNPATNKIYVANQSSSRVTVIDGATNSTISIPVGASPIAVAINSVTNKIYVANQSSNSVTVIDGATNSTITITVGISPSCLAVNSVTNKIYAGNLTGAAVTVIDGASNSTASVAVGSQPGAIALNPVTNKIYTANLGDGTVTVIDGNTNATTAVPVGAGPFAIAVNPVTNRIYVANRDGNSVTVIDGATGLTATVTVGAYPYAVAVNPVTNKIYVVNNNGSSATVIDGVTNASSTVAVDAVPFAVTVNPVTNKIYTANLAHSTVTVIDGLTNAAVTLSTGAGPTAIAANPVTNKVYTANYTSSTVSVIDGATNSTATLNVGSGASSIAVNEVTNKVYVPAAAANSVTVIDGATGAASTVAVGRAPSAVAVNPMTNKIYVSNMLGGSVSVIDGATNAVTTVTTGAGSLGIALNPVTNRIYVANQGANTVTVIDGATNSTSTVTAGRAPGYLAVNPVTNKIYVPNQTDGTVTVIDGVTNSTTTVAVGSQPHSVGVNPVTNTIYVANYGSSNITAIDGVSNLTTVIRGGSQANFVAVNPVTNKIYVSNFGAASVTVIDGATNTATTVNVGANPQGLKVNVATNKIYVAGQGDNTVTVIDGATNTTVTVKAGSAPIAIAVNPVTDTVYIVNGSSSNVTVLNEPQLPANPLTASIAPLPANATSNPTTTFSFTAASTFSPAAPPPRNVFFQLDTWQGLWPLAVSSGSSYIGSVATPQSGLHILYAYAADAQESTSTEIDSPLIGNITAYEFLVSSSASHLSLAAPGSAMVGTPMNFTVSALDASNSVALGYAGPLNFNSTDAAAILPANSTIAGGVSTFAITWKTIGTQTLTATDRVTASITGISGPILVGAGSAAIVSPVAGTPQSATTNTAFAIPLQVAVKDAFNNPVSGVTVVFTAPASGAGATFASNASMATDSTGIATAPSLTANSSAGIYTVFASVAGVASSAAFLLTNAPGSAGSLTAIAGTPQSAIVNTAFATALQASVRDAGNNPIGGATVFFAVPPNAGTFAHSATILTNASGLATAPVFTASAVTGAFIITAKSGLLSAIFNLTNTPGPPASFTLNAGNSQSSLANTAFASPLQVLVTDSFRNSVGGLPITFGAPLSGATGTFAKGASVLTVITNSQGLATSSLFIASGTPGPFAVSVFNGSPAVVATFSLTVLPPPNPLLITFPPIPDQVLGGPAIVLNATSNSALPLLYTVISGPATISGAVLTTTGLGRVDVQASLPGTDAPPVERNFLVSSPAPSVTALLNAASFAAGNLAPNAYATLFGTNLAAATTEAGGVTLSLTDSTGATFPMLLYYVFPTQINFLIPPGIAAGAATMSLNSGPASNVTFAAAVAAVSPGVFSADATGAGMAAGQVLASGNYLYVVLYGTGASSAKNIAITIGGVTAEVLYAGPQSQFPGLDQFNARILASAVSAWPASVVLTADGVTANQVTVTPPLAKIAL